MTNVVVAFSIIFAAIFIYTWLMSSRQKRLEKKLDEIRELVKDRKT
jgi:CcmD family protein